MSEVSNDALVQNVASEIHKGFAQLSRSVDQLRVQLTERMQSPALEQWFSLYLNEHISSGGHTALTCYTEVRDPMQVWKDGVWSVDEQSAGDYHLNLSFVRDPYYHGGTSDDVYALLYVNDAYQINAWAGQTSSAARMTAFGHGILHLAAGDKVQIKIGSDGGTRRFVRFLSLTGVRV